MAVSLAVAGCGDQSSGGGGGRTTYGGDREAEQAAGSAWAAGITPEWMSEQMGLTVPATAQSPKAAYEITSRFDTGLLTFTLTRSEAETYLKENPPEGKWLEPTAAATDVESHDFAHFGLSEPETFKDGVRYSYVCPSPVPPRPPGPLPARPRTRSARPTRTTCPMSAASACTHTSTPRTAPASTSEPTTNPGSAPSRWLHRRHRTERSPTGPPVSRAAASAQDSVPRLRRSRSTSGS